MKMLIAAAMMKNAAMGGDLIKNHAEIAKFI